MMISDLGSAKGLTCLVWFSLVFLVTPDTYKDRGSAEAEAEAGQRMACRFYRSLLDKCSGESDASFGFKEGKPCLIVKLNRIVNFRPRVSSLHT